MTHKPNLMLVCEGVTARLRAEGRDPEDYHNLGIARDLAYPVYGNESWETLLIMNRWITTRTNRDGI